MNTRTCPVCGLEQEAAGAECVRCAWDFSPMLGTAEETRAFLAKRLDEARTAWQERRYNPDLVPELERDPFETWEEFAARIGERPWYVGEAELQKGGYDIGTGRFPLVIQSPLNWAGRWVSGKDPLYLILGRDPARLLYERTPIRPLFAWLLVRDGRVNCDRLVLVADDGELLVEAPTTTVMERPVGESLAESVKCPATDHTAISKPPVGQATTTALGMSGEREVSVRLPQKQYLRLMNAMRQVENERSRPDVLESQLRQAQRQIDEQRGTADRPQQASSVGKATTAVLDKTVVQVPRTPPGTTLGRYRDLGDGTVLDTKTGLQWMDCSLGDRWSRRARTYKWRWIFWRALVFNMFGGFAGHWDWRVPTIEELRSLLVKEDGPPIFNYNWYWSSTPASSSSAWYVYFKGDGGVATSTKENDFFVRLVRGGQ